MKTSLVLTVIVISVGFSGVLPAASQEVCSCRHRYVNCLAAADGTREQCKLLYAASLKEGGVWGSPTARAASKTTGNELFCHVDFE
jgi:hypothetical protein